MHGALFVLQHHIRWAWWWILGGWGQEGQHFKVIPSCIGRFGLSYMKQESLNKKTIKIRKWEWGGVGIFGRQDHK